MSDKVCDVVNCGRPIAGIVTISKDGPDYPLLQAAVCAEHKLAVEAGDRFVMGEGSSILMGEEIALDLINWSLSDPDGSGATLTIEAGRLGGERQTITLWLASDRLAELGEALSWASTTED